MKLSDLALFCSIHSILFYFYPTFYGRIAFSETIVDSEHVCVSLYVRVHTHEQVCTCPFKEVIISLKLQKSLVCGS